MQKRRVDDDRKTGFEHRSRQFGQMRVDRLRCLGQVNAAVQGAAAVLRGAETVLKKLHADPAAPLTAPPRLRRSDWLFIFVRALLKR